MEEVKNLESDFNETDNDIENLTEKISEDETFIQNDDEETELSKFLKRRQEEKDDRVGRFEQYRDHALFSNEDKREDVSLMLELIERSARKDIETLKAAKEELWSGDEAQEEASDIISKLEAQQVKASDLLEKLHENDLNFIRPSTDISESNQSSETNKRIPQDSSDIYQTDFNPLDQIGDD